MSLASDMIAMFLFGRAMDAPVVGLRVILPGRLSQPTMDPTMRPPPTPTAFEVLNCRSREPPGMKRLIVHGEAGFRKDAVIEYDGEELVVFAVNRMGEWHGPERMQMWCTVGTEDEREDFDHRNFIPMHLDVETAEAEAITVIKRAGDLAV